MKQNNIVIFTVISIFIAALLSIISSFGIIEISPSILFMFRWFAIISLVYYGIKKKSLTTWILVSMVIGAEIGSDFQEFSQSLKVLSQIFLRMIKTIIAPLLFGTLVVGIAGHSDIKQVG